MKEYKKFLKKNDKYFSYIGYSGFRAITFKEAKEASDKKEKLDSERTPELLDIGLHVDDIATVAVLSGLKWIEPALPILYGVSGYRAGIGYRNGE